MKTNFFEKNKDIPEHSRMESQTRYARKWDHYLKFYDMIWGEFDKPPRLCEVGVDQGDSIKMFAPFCELVIGIDHKPKMCKFPDNVEYLQSCQSDDQKILNYLRPYIPLDIVIDDASHFYDLTRKTFLNLFPMLKPNGKYIIEDWGAWSQTAGVFHQQQATLDRPNAMLPFAKELVEELAIWGRTTSRRFGESRFAKIEYYENILVIHKKK